MNFSIRIRLSFMMLLEYFIWGAWYVTLGTWLATSLHFSGQQIGLAAGTTAVGAVIAPFFVGLIADRLFNTQRVLALLHIAGAILLYIASLQTSFLPFYGIVLAYCLCFMPTLALTNSLAFRQMKDPREQFGSIRVLGSGGWILAGLLIGTLRLESAATPMRLSFDSVFPREALNLLRERSMLVFAISSFLICIPLQFYYAFTNLFLNQAGVSNAAGKMTGGQISEVICMILIPWFFRRLGVKYMLAAGMLAWIARYIFFAYGNVDSRMWMLWAGILLHGICYDFFFVTGQIYIDRKAPLNLRASAQGLITFITYGIGMFVGSWLSGAVVNHYALPTAQGAMTYDWRAIWIFSGSASVIVLLLFLLSFSDKQADAVEPFPAAEEASLQI